MKKEERGSGRVGPHTNNARLTWKFFSFHSKDKRRTQRHSLCEARQEKMREFQTQLQHHFSKSDNTCKTKCAAGKFFGLNPDG